MLYLFDLDGTLITPAPTTWQPLPGRARKLGALRGQGHTVGVVMDEEGGVNWIRLRSRLQREFEVQADEIGPLDRLMHDLGFGKDETFVVGSTPNDQLHARSAGVEFMWAKEFFQR